MKDTLPEKDATPDEAFELGRVAGYDAAVAERQTDLQDLRYQMIDYGLSEEAADDLIARLDRGSR